MTSPKKNNIFIFLFCAYLLINVPFPREFNYELTLFLGIKHGFEEFWYEILLLFVILEGLLNFNWIHADVNFAFHRISSHFHSYSFSSGHIERVQFCLSSESILFEAFDIKLELKLKKQKFSEQYSFCIQLFIHLRNENGLFLHCEFQIHQ